MKLNVFAAALAATVLGAVSAGAQTAVIEEHHDTPGVVIEHERPAATVTVEKPRAEHKTVIETEGHGDCATKRVHKEGPDGSKTVTKTDCP